MEGERWQRRTTWHTWIIYQCLQLSILRCAYAMGVSVQYRGCKAVTYKLHSITLAESFRDIVKACARVTFRV
jgi:hypothetical protein